MTNGPRPGSADIDRLRTAHPLWAVAFWASEATGPDARLLVATREGARVRAWTAAELSALIAAEEQAHGWPRK
jgi:hypothetical protein